MRTSVSTRRRIAGGVAIAGGVLLALSGLAVPADAQGVGGNQECPEGTTEVAKFERIGDTDDYTPDDHPVVTLSNTSKTSVDWESTVVISHIVVKGGNDATVEEVDPPATSGTVTNENVPEVGQGNIPAISNLKFCTPDEPSDDGGDDTTGGDTTGGDEGGDTNGTTTDDGGTDSVLPTEVTQPPAEVLPQVVEQPAPAAPAPAAAPAQQLPRTGTESDLALIGLGLLMAGAGFVLYSNPIPAFAGRRK
jgi:LPXTG-motif cell wall-anchored protein